MGYFFLFLLLIAAISSAVAISLGYTSRPRYWGFLLFIAGSMTAFFTVDRWASALPGLFGIATLNGIFLTIGQQVIPISHAKSALLTIVMACASLVTAHFVDRSLTNISRAAYLGILSSFVAMLTCIMTSIQRWELPVCVGFIVSILVLLGCLTRKSKGGSTRKPV